MTPPVNLRLSQLMRRQVLGLSRMKMFHIMVFALNPLFEADSSLVSTSKFMSVYTSFFDDAHTSEDMLFHNVVQNRYFFAFVGDQRAVAADSPVMVRWVTGTCIITR